MIEWLVETLVTVTVLMLLVLAVRGPVARLFGAGWAYALWAVPAARLALPALPQLTPNIALPAATFIPAVGSAAPLPADAGPGQWVPLMLAIWAGGAVIFLTLQWLAYREFLHRMGETARPGRPPSYGGIMTLVSQAVEGPLALGLLERRIVLPADFLRRYNCDERRLALEHELTHHRRGDIWWNVLATVVLALNWFNPVAWIAFRAFRADQELSCDAAVAARASAAERCDYARALVKSASRPGLIGACALNTAGALKLRLRMMRCHRVSGARTAGGVAAFALFATAGFAVGKPDYVPAEAAPVLAAAAPAPTWAAPAAAAAPARVAAPVVAVRPMRAAAAIAPRARVHAVRRAAAIEAHRPLLLAATPIALAEPLAIEPAPQPTLRRRVVRIERHDVIRAGHDPHLFTFTAPIAVPHREIAEVIERVTAAAEGGGGAMLTDALLQMADVRVSLRGLRFRAPEMWDDEDIWECNR